MTSFADLKNVKNLLPIIADVEKFGRSVGLDFVLGGCVSGPYFCAQIGNTTKLTLHVKSDHNGDPRYRFEGTLYYRVPHKTYDMIHVEFEGSISDSIEAAFDGGMLALKANLKPVTTSLKHLKPLFNRLEDLNER